MEMAPRGPQIAVGRRIRRKNLWLGAPNPLGTGAYRRHWLPVAGSRAGRLSVCEDLVEVAGIERASPVGLSVISEGGVPTTWLSLS